MPFSLGGDGNRRVTIPLTFGRRVRRQPITPVTQPVELDDGQIKTAAEMAALENSVFIMQSEAAKAAEQSAHASQLDAEALELTKARNAGIEDVQQQDTQAGLWELARGFAPDRASDSTVQALSSNPKYMNMEPTELWEVARMQEGSRNAAEFQRRVGDLPPEERGRLAPLMAGLQREGLDPQLFQRIITAASRGDDSIYEFPVNEREAANRVVSSMAAQDNHTAVRRASLEGATDAELKALLSEGLKTSAASQATIPVGAKGDATLTRWGERQLNGLDHAASRLQQLEPELTREDAEQMAWDKQAEDGQWLGRFREFETTTGTDQEFDDPEGDPGFFGDLANFGKRLTGVPQDRGELTDRIKGAIKGFSNIVQGAPDVVQGGIGAVGATTQPLLELPGALVTEAGEVTIEVLSAAARGDFAQARDELREGAGEIGGEFVEAVEGIREPIEAVIEITREAIQGDLDGVLQELREAGQEVPQVGHLLGAWDGLNQMFLGEQQVITPFTKPLIKDTLLTFQVPESNANSIAKFAAEILVPSTFIGGVGLLGKVKKATTLGAKMKRLLPIALSEGSINMLQNRAGRRDRGEEPPSLLEDLLMFGGGFGVIIGMPVVGKALGEGGLVRRTMQFLNQETGGATTRGVPGGVGGEAGQRIPGGQGFPKGVQRGAEAATEVVPRVIPEATDEGITVMFHGTSGDVGDTLRPGTNLTPNKADAQTFAEADARLTGGNPQVVEVRVKEGATQLVSEEAGLARARGAVEVVDPENAFVVPREAPTEAPGVVSRAGEFLGGERGAATTEGLPGGVPSGRPAQPDAGRATQSNPDIQQVASEQPARLDEEAVVPQEVARNPEPSVGKGSDGPPEDTDEFIDAARGRSGGSGGNTPPTKVPASDDFTAKQILENEAIRYKGRMIGGESAGIQNGREIDGMLRRATSTEAKGLVENIADIATGARQRITRGTGDDLLARDGGDLSTSFGVKQRDPEVPADFRNVIENPEKFNIPKPVQDVIDHSNRRVRELVELLVDRDVLPKELLEQDWIRRIVVRLDDTSLRVGPKPGVGATQGFQLPRTRAFVVNGDERQYLSSWADTLEIFTKEVHQKVAGVDMARNLGLDTAEWVRASDEAFGDPVRALEILQARQDIGVRTLKTPADVKSVLNKARNAKTTLNNQMQTLKARIRQARLDANKTKVPATKAAITRRADQLAERLSELEARLPEVDEALTNAKAESAVARQKATKIRPDEAGIREPLFGGKAVGREGAKAFTKRMGKPGTGDTFVDVLSAVNKVQDPVRSIWANIDASVAGLQTLASAGRNPRGWAEVMGRSLGAAFLDPKFVSEFFVKNKKYVELFRQGGGILHKGSTAIDPEIKPSGMTAWLFNRGPFKISMDMWNNAVDMMSVSNLRQTLDQAEAAGMSLEGVASAYREGFPNLVDATKSADPLDQIVAAMAHFSGQMTAQETARLGAKTAVALRALPFAGKYWLGWAKAIASMRKLNPEGAVARRMFAGWLTAGVGFYSVAAIATGQEPNLNPLDKDFMTLTVAGQKVGIGGPLQQTISLMARIADDPTNSRDITTRWLRGKSAPMWSTLADLVNHETFVGDPIDVDSYSGLAAYFSGQLMPFTLQDPVFEGARAIDEGKGPGAIAAEFGRGFGSVPASAVGLRGFPASPFDVRDSKAQDLFDKDYTDLLGTQREEVDEALGPGVQAQIDEDSARKQEVEDVTNTAFALSDQFQKQNLASLAKAATQVTTGGISHRDFREVVGDLDMKGRGQREVIEALMIQAGLDLDSEEAPFDSPKDATEQTKNDLWGYFQIFEKYPDADVDPVEKDALFNEIDRFRGDLSTAREDAMDAEIGIQKKDVKLYATLRKDRADITDSGFFELSDGVWDTLREGAGIDLPETRHEYIESLQQQVVEQHGARFGNLPPEALSVLYANDPVLALHEKMLSVTKQKFLIDNRAIANLVLKWGYLPSSFQNLAIASAGTPQLGTVAPTAPVPTPATGSSSNFLNQPRFRPPTR